jgi:hypothetical protein
LVSDIRLDGGTQARERIDQDVVGEYARHLDDLPPSVVFFDGTFRWMADGFHRYHAHGKAGRITMPCEVRQGTARDAVLFAAGANTTHGLQRNNADKRHAVLMLLADEVWRKRSDRWIAEQCRVSDHLVADVRRSTAHSRSSGGEVETSTGDSASSESAKREGKDGKKRSLRRPRRVAFHRLDGATKGVLGDHVLTRSEAAMLELRCLPANMRADVARSLVSGGTKTVKEALAIIKAAAKDYLSPKPPVERPTSTEAPSPDHVVERADEDEPPAPTPPPQATSPPKTEPGEVRGVGAGDAPKPYDVMADVLRFRDLFESLSVNWKREEDKVILKDMFRQFADEV